MRYPINFDCAKVGDEIRLGGGVFKITDVYYTLSIQCLEVTSDYTVVSLSVEGWKALGAEVFRQCEPLPNNLGAVVLVEGGKYVRVARDGSNYQQWIRAVDPTERMYSRDVRRFGYKVLHEGWEGCY